MFSGGSAANSVIDVFTALCKDSRGLEFVLPVSDNGGSTSGAYSLYLSCRNRLAGNIIPLRARTHARTHTVQS